MVHRLRPNRLIATKPLAAWNKVVDGAVEVVSEGQWKFFSS